MAWKPDYVTSAELKSYLRIEDAADDPMVALWVTTASRAVDDYCGRQFGQTATVEERTYDAVYDRACWRSVAEIDDVQDVTDMVVTDANGNEVAADDYELGPVNAPVKGRPYTRVLLARAGRVTIAARWGWSAVPAPVKNATLLQAARLAARRDAPFGIAGSPAEGSEVRLMASLDPDLRTALGGTYRRSFWAA